MSSDTSVVHSVQLPHEQSGELLRFTREQVGWEWMSFVVRRLLPGESLSLKTKDEEMGLVFLGGRCIADWGEGKKSIGGRKNVFEGLPYALYLPSAGGVDLHRPVVEEPAEQPAESGQAQGEPVKPEQGRVSP